MIFTCDKCHHEWKDTDYDEESPKREGFYAQGLYCPKCGSGDIAGKPNK